VAALKRLWVALAGLARVGLLFASLFLLIDLSPTPYSSPPSFLFLVSDFYFPILLFHPPASKFALEMVSSVLARIRPEKSMAQLDRITQDPQVMGGKPCIRGMRVTVGMIVGQIGAGHTIEEVLAEYPYLEREDVLQALRYAKWRSSTNN